MSVLFLYWFRYLSIVPVVNATASALYTSGAEHS
jgi:hypothetical protein